MMDYQKLINDVNDVLEDAKKNKQDIGGAINWADLWCRSVEEVMNYEPSGLCHRFIRINIEESAYSSDLMDFVLEGLVKKGYSEDMIINTFDIQLDW